MSTPMQRPTSTGSKIFYSILAIIGLLGILVGFGAWAVSSPVSGSPDDDYHLGSIWCPRPIEGSGCKYEVKDGTITSVEVPEPITDSKKCVAFKPEQDASCGVDSSDETLVPTERFDKGGYPWGYYQFHHLLVGEDVYHSVVMMRLINVLIGLGALFLVGVLAAPHIRHPLLVASLVAWVPMGVYFIASNNPTSWALTGCLVYGASLFSSTEASGKRRWALLGTMTLGGIMAVTSRTDSSFYLFVISLAMWFLIKLTRERLLSLIFSVGLSLLGMLTLVSSGQAASLTGDGGWPSYPHLSSLRIFVLNVQSLPEHIASWWGLTWGPGWFDVPLLGWSTLAMVFVVGGVVFVAAHKLHVRKILSITIMLGALLGIPVVSLTLRQVQPVVFYQGRYMLPLLAVTLLVWLVRRDKKIFFRSPAQLVLLVGIVGWANSMALRQVIRRYSSGLTDNFIIGFGEAKWWPWALSPTTVWALGSLAMFLGVSLLLIVTVRTASSAWAEQPAVSEETPDFFDITGSTTTPSGPTVSSTSVETPPVSDGVSTPEPEVTIGPSSSDES